MERNSKNTAHVHGWDEGEKTSASGLEPCGVMNESNEDTNSVQVCSILHVTHVHVRRVIHVIVHSGLTGLSLYTLLRSHFRSHLFVNCCIRRYSLYTPRR